MFKPENDFLLLNHQNEVVAKLIYENDRLENCRIITPDLFSIKFSTTGVWQFFSHISKKEKLLGIIRLTVGGIMSIQLNTIRKKYILKRTGTFNSRFSLLSNKEEEIMGIIPTINWQKKSYEMAIQINADYTAECTSFLILLTAHCAISYLNMLNGAVPALINI